MKKYYIEDARCDVSTGGFACGPVGGEVVATVRFSADGRSQWISMIEFEGIPMVFLTDTDLHDYIANNTSDRDYAEHLEQYMIEEFNGITCSSDYNDIFDSVSDDPDNPAIPLLRYLIALVRCSWDEIGPLVAMAKGHYIDELDIPISDVEEDYQDRQEDEDEMDLSLPEDIDKETLYRMRLSQETDVETESIFHDLDEEAFEAEKAQLKEIIERCEDEEDYQAWKQSYIDTAYEKAKDREFLVCKYMFAGIGQYEMIIPKEEKESFICWINGNGSAFFTGEREATEDEIKKFVALHATQEI